MNNTPIVKLESATLNIGKSYPKILVSTKSTTSPFTNRSIKFPNAPANSKLIATYINRLYFLL